MIENLNKVLQKHEHSKNLKILYTELIDFMIKSDWRGACHESCGVQYVIINELGIECEWRLGEVFFKERKIQNRPVCFDHSWILIDNEIFDIALLKTNFPEIDSFPTIRNLNLKTLGDPEVIYDTDSGWGDDMNTRLLKATPLSEYLNMSPMHPQYGTWILIKHIFKKLDIEFNIDELRQKYNGIYWK